MSRPEKAQGFDAERHIDALAPTLGLAITPGQRPGVVRFLQTAHAMADLVLAAPLDPNLLELAPAFRPGPTGGDNS